MVIDTHAHLMFPEFKEDFEDVLKRAKEAGVTKIINVGCNIIHSQEAVKMADDYDFLYATLGIHPYDAEEVSEKLMKKWESEIRKNSKIVGIGETGLDYFKAQVDREVQKRAFNMQLELAQEVGLPVIVHNREADEDSLEILRKFDGRNGRRVEAVFHCYGSSLDFARKIWDLGYMTSFTGIITFPKAEGLREVVRECPLDKIMIETDCPYLAPQGHRGERNEPSYVLEVLKGISGIKYINEEALLKQIYENSNTFFGGSLLP